MTGTDLATQLDFDIAGTESVGSAAELCALFRERPADAPPIRLCGAATRQRELPAPRAAPLLVSTAPMRRITRFEPDDLTCSVEPGVSRAALDAALAEKRLRLPTPAAGGTLGGSFALGREAWPGAPGALGIVGTRAVLLGLAGVLAEGKAFKSGARVVKNVAGFDVHKLFVGSRGRLFAVTELHLKLRPLPRARAAFAADGLEADAAVALWRALRLDDHPPASVWLVRHDGRDTFAVSGAFEGAPRIVADRMRAHGLDEAGDAAAGPGGDAALERISGLVRPSRVAALLAMLPARRGVVVNGTGAFACRVAPAEADRLLPTLPDLDVAAELDLAPPERRGRTTGTDPGAATIRANLQAALDPEDVLT